MKWPTVYKFYDVSVGVAVEASYDTGWNEENQCEGKGGYEYVVEFVDGAVILILRAFGDPTDTVTVTLNRDRLFFDVSLPVNSSAFSCRMGDGAVIVEANVQAITKVQQGIINVPRGH